MMRLHLHATNGVRFPSNHCAFYLWLLIIVLIFIVGPCITNKQNIVSNTIPGIYLMVRSDVIKPQNAVTELIEHQFGTFCQDTYEFNIHELAHMCEKNSRSMDLIFSNVFIPSQDPRKGYGETFLQWYNYNRCRGQEIGGSVVVSGDAGPVIGQVWSVVRGLISLYLKLRGKYLMNTSHRFISA